MSDKHMCQVAFCSKDAPALRDWYHKVFGFVKAGRILFAPPATTQVQGIPNAWEDCRWLIDKQDYFQLEFFKFLNPTSKDRPGDWSPADIGYNMISIAVDDFDYTLTQVGRHTGAAKPLVHGKDGERRACMQDIDGNWFEVLEADPIAVLDGDAGDIVRPEVPAVVRAMRVSVPSLDDARETFVDAMGMVEVEGYKFHTPKDEAMWGLEGAKARSMVVRTRNFLLELVQYQAPKAKPWDPDYRICDQGYMNVALGYANTRDFDQSFEHATSHGMKPNGKPSESGIMKVMYVNDKHRFSIEMLLARRKLWNLSGFTAQEPYVDIDIDINAPADKVWDLITDHSGMGEWSIFDGKVLREGDDTNGPGCVRELKGFGGIMRITEQVEAWEPDDRHYTYRLLSGAPFSKHRGDIYVTEYEDGTTNVRWAIRFDSWIPMAGKPTELALSAIFKRDLKSQKRLAERAS